MKIVTCVSSILKPKSHIFNIILNIAFRLPVICTVPSSQQKRYFFGKSSHAEELHAIILVANFLSGD